MDWEILRMCTTEYKRPEPGKDEEGNDSFKIATSWEPSLERKFGDEFHHLANDEKNGVSHVEHKKSVEVEINATPGGCSGEHKHHDTD